MLTKALQSRAVERMSWVPTESMLADDTTKAMVYGSCLWPIVYAMAYWQPFRRPELNEDWATWTAADGQVTRWHLSDVVLAALRGTEGASQSW